MHFPFENRKGKRRANIRQRTDGGMEAQNIKPDSTDIVVDYPSIARHVFATTAHCGVRRNLNSTSRSSLSFASYLSTVIYNTAYSVRTFHVQVQFSRAFSYNGSCGSWAELLHLTDGPDERTSEPDETKATKNKKWELSISSGPPLDRFGLFFYVFSFPFKNIMYFYTYIYIYEAVCREAGSSPGTQLPPRR